MAQEGREPPAIARIFVNDDGTSTPRAQNDTNEVVLQLRNGHKIVVKIADLFGGQRPSPCVGVAAVAFGVSTSLGNAGNTAASAAVADVPRDERAKALKDLNPEVIENAITERLESILKGEWAGEGFGGGAGPQVLLEAIDRYRKSQGQGPMSDDKKAEMTARLKSEEGYDKTLLKHPGIKAAHEAVKAERAAARAAAKAADAKGADVLEDVLG